MDKEKFNQKEYIKEWAKENMMTISGRYKKEFVLEFKSSCKKLGIKQSDVYREAMQAVIDHANEQE